MASDPAVARHEMNGLLRRGRLTSFDPGWFTYGEHVLEPKSIQEILQPHMSEARIRRIDEVLADRTYNLAVVVDGMVDTGNVSAVMRSADSFGVQAFHAIDRSRTYKHSRRTAQGARKWVDRWVWPDAADALAALREGNYRIVVADLDPVATPIADVDFSVPTALVFGNELAGVSDEFRAAADETVSIEMSGFAQSLNISVAAAICLYEARRDRVARLGKHGDLTATDRERLKAVFAIRSVRHARMIIERWLAKESAPPG